MLENYTVIDLEMTGLNVKTDAIIETGAVRVRGGEIADTYSALLFTGRMLPERITELTGITAEMVRRRTGAGGGDGRIFCVCGGGYPRRTEYYV